MAPLSGLALALTIDALGREHSVPIMLLAAEQVSSTPARWYPGFR